MQRQVAAGSKLSVFGDHDVLVIVKIDGVNADIAVLRHRMAVDRDDAVRHKQINVFLGGNGILHRNSVNLIIVQRHFANIDIAEEGIHGHTAVLGSNGGLDIHVTLLSYNGNIFIGQNISL